MSNLTLSSAEIPYWLTANFLRDLLQISDRFELKSIKHACKKGENFASKIFRIKIVCNDDEEQTIILKSRPFDEVSFSEDFLKKFDIFPKEMEAYGLVRCFEEILCAAGLETSFGAR